jgi:predicted GNAT family acetyltransferase
VPTAHPLDRPVWSALTGGQAHLAQGDGRALRFPPDYGPFAAEAEGDLEGQTMLAAFEPGSDGLWLVEPQAAAPPAGMAAAGEALCAQMTACEIAGDAPGFEATPLGDADGPQMLALARLTKPGPFAVHTHRLGRFIGVKLDGRLVAMAGERMKPSGFTEVSGVCTHPDFRGRGYAGGLMRLVARRILERGETPFLHAYASNAGAIELYRTLGFTVRRTVVLTILKRDGSEQQHGRADRQDQQHQR